MPEVLWIIVAIVVIFIVYNGYKGNKDTKNVERFGGIDIKYATLVRLFMSNEKLQLYKHNANNLEIGYAFVGGGYVRFKLIEMSGKLQVAYQSKDMVDGLQNLVWNFDENQDQNKMFEKVSDDLAIHAMLSNGMTREEAIVSLQEMKNQQE